MYVQQWQMREPCGEISHSNTHSQLPSSTQPTSYPRFISKHQQHERSRAGATCLLSLGMYLNSLPFGTPFSSFPVLYQLPNPSHPPPFTFISRTVFLILHSSPTSLFVSTHENELPRRSSSTFLGSGFRSQHTPPQSTWPPRSQAGTCWQHQTKCQHHQHEQGALQAIEGRVDP